MNATNNDDLNEGVPEVASMAVLCFMCMLVLLLGFGIYQWGYAKGRVENLEVVRVDAALHTGIPLPGGPVMLWMLDDYGQVKGESAIATDFAGVLPYSITAKAVPCGPYTEWFAWSELDSRFTEVAR
jgi:hypothetical protein